MRSSLRFAALGFCLAAAIALDHGPAPVHAVEPQAAPPDSLEAVFEPGTLLQDRDADGVVDFVNVRLVLGEPSTPVELAAAADVAVRLGLETLAMDLPVDRSRDSDGFPVVVGDAGMSAAGIGPDAAGLTGLEEGQGVIALVTRPTGPALVVAGVDENGTRRAAHHMAGRFPHVWAPDGMTLGELTEGLRAHLTDAGVNAPDIRALRIVLGGGAGGAERLDLEVRVDSDVVLDAAEEALGELRAGAAGGEPPVSLAGLHTLHVELAGPAARRTVEVEGTAAVAEEGPVAGRPGTGAKEELDLSSLYENEGLLGDSDGNLIPDRIDALLSPSGGEAAGIVDVAARLGLESAGIVVPVARGPNAVGDPAAGPTLVLVGSDHPLVQQLVDDGRVDLSFLAPGQGLIQVVPEAHGDKGAVVVAGADDAGLERALSQLGERLPWIWDRGKDRTTVGDVEEELYRLVSGRSPAGQAATALYKLDGMLAELGEEDLQNLEIGVHVEKAEAGLEGLVRQRVADAGLGVDPVDVFVENLDVQEAGTVFEEEFEIPSEVEEFWSVFRSDVLPDVGEGSAVSLEVRLSEPPEVRADVVRRIRQELDAAGADAENTSVTVLSAYKQGYSWLYDEVRPALEGRDVDHLTIRFAEAGPPPEWQQQAMYTPTRWLKETFPIDEVLANETGLTLEQIEFEMTPVGTEPTYEVIATDPAGEVVHQDTFDPTYVVRPYFDRFPEYEKVRVTTGWIDARVDGESVVDQRIATDPERFWNHFQSETLPEMYQYAMDLTDGKPEAADAPFFGELRVDLTLSEPSYRIGVDQEQISSVESIHEEIYFGTLHFFDVLGRVARGTPLDYPGRIIPISKAKSDGTAGNARITFSGFDEPRPSVVARYTTGDGFEREARRDIRRVEMERPRALTAVVAAGADGIARLDFRLQVDFEEDRRGEWLQRARAESIDGEIMTAEQVGAILENLTLLRGAGLYRDALAVQDLGEMRIASAWEWEPATDARVIASLPANGDPAPFPDIAELLPGGWEYTEGETLVQWEEPIPPGEAFEIVAKMAVTFPEARAYKVGESYLGKELWAMDLMPPIEASHWSQAKASTLKPTVVYSARQHANEVSSTSHVLRLAEMILTDPEYRAALDTVNVVIHPITNADGAQLAYDLYQITPDQMLHAGYLGSLGVDVTASQGSDDPIYPETRVRPELWRTWLPDIFLNPHGYPSHEWVQMFSEYAAWVRNRVTESRDWWGMRGWFIPGFAYLEDPEYPRHEDAAMEIRERITENINAVDAVRELNERAYDRYSRYSFQFDQENFKLDFTDDVLIYTPIVGARAGGGDDYMVQNPEVTIWTGGTEAPDETAYGDWLELVATMGLQWDKAILSYLVEGEHEVKREKSTFWDGVSLKLHRPRPPESDEGQRRDGR